MEFIVQSTLMYASLCVTKEECLAGTDINVAIDQDRILILELIRGFCLCSK